MFVISMEMFQKLKLGTDDHQKGIQINSDDKVVDKIYIEQEEGKENSRNNVIVHELQVDE